MVRERSSFSLGGTCLGALIGLVSGLLLGYLGLFEQTFLHLPWPATAFGRVPVETWFVPLLVVTTLLGALYYHAEA